MFDYVMCHIARRRDGVVYIYCRPFSNVYTVRNNEWLCMTDDRINAKYNYMIKQPSPSTGLL